MPGRAPAPIASCRTFPWNCKPARSSPCWAPAAWASPRCCGCSRACSGRWPARSACAAGIWPVPPPDVGFVFQDPCLLPWLTLEENVAFGLDFRHQPRLDDALRRQRVQQAIAEVGLAHARTRYPDELSGGMAQRAALARSLARAPEILLLDEPFSALDEVTRGEMQTLLLEVSARHRAAAILVTHDIDEALLLADRILLLGGQPGRLIGQWRPDRVHPRDETDPHLTALRVEILQALRAARPPKPNLAS